MTSDRYYNRSYIIGGIVVAVAAVFICRLFYLQVIDRSTVGKSESNALVKQTVYPSRGMIYDRRGELLVYNRPVYDVMMVMREMGKEFDTVAFCRTMHISEQTFNERMQTMSNRRKNPGFSRYTPQPFLNLLTAEDVSLLQEQLYRFPGIRIRKRTLRDYTYSAAAHVLGSVGEVSKRDLDNDPYYAIGDYAGRDGIERQYETLLRGEKGMEVLMRDVHGRIQGSYQNGELDYPPVSGQDLTLTLDIRLQLLAEQLMQNKMGSVVALEPQTGEVLAMVSVPKWDPAVLVGRDRSQNYAALLQDKHKPLMNRAVQAQYPPGSTFKLIQALIGLQTKTINSRTEYACNGPESLPIKCTHHHGSPVDLVNGIEQSCNPYFWQEFRDILRQNGGEDDTENLHRNYDRWRDYVVSFGFGSRFPTDIREQAAGSIPTSQFYDKHYGRSYWRSKTIRSLSIGQGEILVTPLQLANEAAAIANEGWYIAPHLVRGAFTDKHQTAIDAHCFPIVKEGMQRVMTNGTGRYYNIADLQMCGKTGTVQNPHGKDHAIFIGFAPKDNPRIAVAVVVENAGFGATWACPVASLMMEQYLTDTITRQELKERMQTAILIQ
ncbi:MAG: penicillin-binding protein 2 [Paludibacteraceae bacterium]|nr:penicillin-binding protein 2 [Paludibacteraceae bacterium]